MVLGTSALEEPPRVSQRRVYSGLALGAALLTVGLAVQPRVARAVGEDPVAEVAEALRSLGPPGVVWGRLTIEEESPVGAWTPLNAVQVTLYPATPALVTELEKIRQSARTSGAQFESAVTRVQAALAAHQSRIDGQSPPVVANSLVAEPPALPPRRSTAPGAPKGSAVFRPLGGTERVEGAELASGPAEEGLEVPHPWRQRTDSAGLFAFDAVPSGDWLVVLVRVSAYDSEKLRSEPKPRQSGRGMRFLPSSSTPPREAEMWVTRVRVVAAERIGLVLTDRARWLAGPVR
jgi:hypothetical protein